MHRDDHPDDTPALGKGLLWVQPVSSPLTGIWPLISIESFQAVTGPKTDHLMTGREADHWLVMTAGLAMLVAAWRGRVSAEIVTLAVGMAVGLTAIDVIYVRREVVSPVY